MISIYLLPDCIRVCVLLYVCSAVYETRTYGAMRGAGGNSPHLLYCAIPPENSGKCFIVNFRIYLVLRIISLFTCAYVHIIPHDKY